MANVDVSMYILWPEYFDSNLSRADGRRMPKELSIPSPNVEDIFKVARKLGLSPVLEKERSFPSRFSHQNGRIKVSKKFNKTETMKKIAQGLKR